jgi:hypothetical protein
MIAYGVEPTSAGTGLATTVEAMRRSAVYIMMDIERAK